MMTEVEQKQAKGHCPSCGPDRNADVQGFYHSRWDDDEHPVWGEKDYYILQCRGCGDIFFKTTEIFSEDVEYRGHPFGNDFEQYWPEKIEYWPAPSKRNKPDWSEGLVGVDPLLHSLWSEVYLALNSDLRVLAAIGIRTVFDRASELLQIDPSKPFQQKIEDLLTAGKIGADERDTFVILTDAGGAAAHRGWKPSLKELGTMMEIIEAFVYRNFILESSVKALQGAVPQKAKRTSP